MGKLTVRGIDSAKPKDKPYKLMDGDGLQLRVAVDGTKTWLVRYIIGETERQYRLPKLYRDVGGDAYFSLQEARDEASRIRALARQGVDHQVEIEKKLAAKAQSLIEHAVNEAAREAKDKTQNLTVQDMFDAWLVDGVRRKNDNAELRRSFAADVLPKIGAIAIKDLTEHDLRATLRVMVDRGVNRAAVMVRNSLTQMFSWAEKRQPWRKLLADGNPMDLIEIERIVAPDFDMENYRDRLLAPAEICELRDIFERMHAEYDAAPGKRFGAQPLDQKTERGIWIMLSTLCRVGEMTMAKWEHVDMAKAEWFIPKENVKDNVANLTVYLSAFALDQFRLLHEVTGHTDGASPRGTTTGTST